MPTPTPAPAATPPGDWVLRTLRMLRAEHASGARATHVLATLGTAQADAFIAAGRSSTARAGLSRIYGGVHPTSTMTRAERWARRLAGRPYAGPKERAGARR